MISFLNKDNYINLERKYSPIASDQNDLDSLAIKSQIALLSGKSFGYTIYDLLKYPLTVVLGEARSGKTTEFRLACKKLNKEGRFAFFIRLEELVQPGTANIEAISNALGREEDRFEEWIKGNKEAIFFLDAVDEAKLQNPNNYHKAVRNFRKSLRLHLHRCRVIVSCRVSEWRPKNDLEPLEKLRSFLIKPHDSSNEDKIHLVQLCPLDEGQIKKIAQHRGLYENEISKFIEELKSVGAIDYAGRPGDAIELVDLWKRDRRLGTLSEITEQNIDRKLQEESDVYNARISIEKARLGAERLAAAAIFCGKSAFRIAPPEEDPQNPLPALDPFKLLSEWSKEDVKALLRRPIFDEATYGRVRFHTRTVQEYLAASWLKKRHEQGCPAKEIVNIFFATRFGETVIRKKFSSVAAWLAPNLPELLDALCQYNPEVLPDKGDPQALLVEQRAEILKSFVKRYSDRDYTGFWYDFQKLRRFATSELSDCIIELLGKPSITRDAKRLLLNLVQTGEIPECSKKVLEIALDQKEDEQVRIYALLALKPYALDELREIYEALQKEEIHVLQNYYSWAMYALYPEVIGPHELLELIAKVLKKGFSNPERLKNRLKDIFAKEKDKKRLEILIPGLWKLINPADNTNEGSNSTNQFRWLLEGLCIGLCNWFSAGGESLSNLFDILDFFEKKHPFDYQGRKLNGALKKSFSKASSKLRRAYFHHRFSIFANKYDREEIYGFQFLNSFGILEPVFHDLDWLIEESLSNDDARYRFTAFNMAIQVCLSEKDKCDPIIRLQPILEKHPDFKKHLDRISHPPVNRRKLASELRGKIKELKKKWQNVLFKEEILPHLSDIASGQDEERLVKIFNRFQQLTSKKNPAALKTLLPIIGENGVAAFRSGLINFWQKWEPDDKRRIGDDMALLGVSCSLEEGMSFDSLSEPQISKLIKLALKELDLPKWFGELIKRYPKLVTSKITPLILQELNSVETGTENIPNLFLNIIYEYPKLINLLKRYLLKWVNEHLPLSKNTRTYIVRALSVGECINDFKVLVETHFKYYKRLSKDDDILDDSIFWLAVWLQVDAIKALDQLEKILDRLSPEKADRFILYLVNKLYLNDNNGTGFQGLPDYQSVDALARFIPIVFAHIRFEDDPAREGIWIQDERDYAQNFRRELVESLARLPGKRSAIELLRIRDEISLKDVKDWLLRTIEEKIDRESFLFWTEKDVLEFEKKNEHAPLTVDDLFEIGLKRIKEIKNDLERGDYSLRELFNESTHEIQVQKYLARRLQELSRSRYSVVRESEVDNKKKPDIQLLHSGLPPVSIEVKRAHKLPVTKLEKGLENQLVGQYLKAADSTHGIYLLVNAKPGKTWPYGTGKLDFHGLILHLQVLAREIESGREGVERLEVIGIDLT